MGSVRLLAALGCAAAAVGGGSARAAVDPYASLLAPAGVCGAAADQLSLDANTAEQMMLCLTNYARAQSGLAPLTANALLDQAGHAKLDADLACGEFSHTPCGNPFELVFATYLRGASGYQLGENIAWGTGEFGTRVPDATSAPAPAAKPVQASAATSAPAAAAKTTRAANSKRARRHGGASKHRIARRHR